MVEKNKEAPGDAQAARQEGQCDSLLDEIREHGRLSIMTFLPQRMYEYGSQYNGEIGRNEACEWVITGDLRIKEEFRNFLTDGEYTYKSMKLLTDKFKEAECESELQNLYYSLWSIMRDHRLSEICTMGPITQTQWEKQPHPYQTRTIKVPGSGARGFFEKCGFLEPKCVERKLMMKVPVGERPLMLGEICDYGGDSPAYGLFYHNCTVDSGGDSRGRQDSATVLLPQNLAEEAWAAVEKNPELIRRIVTRMVSATLGFTEERWLHTDMPNYDNHRGIGIKYLKQRGGGRLYVDGPDAPMVFSEERIRHV